MAEPGVERVDRLTSQQAQTVLALRDTVAAAEGASPLSDHVVMAIRDGTPGRHLLRWRGDTLVGYANLEDADGETAAELAASDPAAAEALLDGLLGTAGTPLRVWARGEHSPLNELLSRSGFQPARTLLQLRRPLDDPIAAPTWPPGVGVRTFAVGQDESAWLTVNNAAFAEHPDQSGWTLEDIAVREREAWFDPAGFFLAERDGDLVGFHWTKIHPARGPQAEPVGEVYVIGVSPAMQGQRLGGALLLHGLGYLRGSGLKTVMLYVDATNTGAVELYERMGFSRWDVDRCYRQT